VRVGLVIPIGVRSLGRAVPRPCGGIARGTDLCIVILGVYPISVLVAAIRARHPPEGLVLWVRLTDVILRLVIGPLPREAVIYRETPV
jgi:hypothetical protein